MKYLIACAVFVIGARYASADYLQLSRAATLKAEPAGDADVIENLSASTNLALIEDTQTNGYYHVQDNAGTEGWVYRTLGRRFRGKAPGSAPSSGGTSGAAGGPKPGDFVTPAAVPAWGMPSKTTGCKSANGMPDVGCTPGDIIASETEDTVCSPDFHTGTVRDHTTSMAQKNQVYPMYGEPHPSNNTGANQMCEIDHLVSLQLGGADTMANLWPECSPGYQGWQGPGFRDKDGFENFLWFHVCKNKDLSLKDAQIQIAVNWRHYWELAGKPACGNRQSCE
jgi:hypothetical protein